MGNDPGKPLGNNEKSTVVLDLTGPLNPNDAKSFKEKLEKLLADYKATGCIMTVAIKK